MLSPASTGVPVEAGAAEEKVQAGQVGPHVPEVPSKHPSARPAKPLAEVQEPTAEEVARNCLKQLPFKRV